VADHDWTMARAIKEALAHAFAADDAIVLLGEETYRGGLFGVTSGLDDPYIERMFEIAGDDALRVGAAIGMALAGAKPVVEVLLSDHLLPALPQIVGELANLRYFSAGELVAPVVLRVPVARGTGAGPRQTLAPERLLAGVPGLVVACPSSPQDAYGIIRAALAGADPVAILEPAVLYGVRGAVDPDIGLELGRARRVVPGTDLVIVAWGAAVAVAREAARRGAELGLSIGVLDLVTLAPLDAGAILEAVAATGRAVIAGDEPRTGGLGAEVAAMIAEGALEYLRAPVLRIGGADAPLPSTGEGSVRGLDAEALLAAARDTIAWR